MANNESDKLNTGIGGFVVDGRLHQMTPGDPNLVEPSDPISPSEKKGRLAEVDLSGDIPRTTKTTMADYLGRSTVRKNYYPLDGDSFNQGTSILKEIGEKANQVVGLADVSSVGQLGRRVSSIFKKKPEVPPSSKEISITTPGNAYVPPIESTSNSNYFADPTELSSAEVPYELQGWYPPQNNAIDTMGLPNLPFAKGRSQGWDAVGTATGNNLLRDELDPSQPSLAATEKVLRVLKQNRFTPRGTLGLDVESNTSISLLSLQNTEASVSVGLKGGWARDKQGIIDGSFHGEALQAAASGSTDYNPPLHNPRYPELHASDMAIASDLLLNEEYSNFSEVFDALAYDENLKKEVRFISLRDPSAIGKNIYTSENMFDGASDIVISALGQFSLKTIATNLSDRLPMEFIDEHFLFNDETSIENFKHSIGVGLDIFYNKGNEIISAYATKSPPKTKPWLLTNTGKLYSNEILRSISTSIMSAINEYNISLNGVTNIHGDEATKVFGKSRLAKILVAFSKIGESQIQRISHLASLQARKERGGIDNFLDGSKKQIGTNLMSKWSSNAAKSRFLEDINLSSIPGPLLTKPGNTRLDDHKYKIMPDQPIENRISKKNIDFLERELDSDYMPFYFHDLRTNEIITFHAFLSSLSDGFSASYDSIEGFGRVEPIKIYKGTQRKISMEFSIVATSSEDFDIMWHKINKLVTLVYPQYTEGRRLKQDGYNFVQPFSQMMGAAPLIRIRLGNVLRSNYSRFALAKLFGAGLEDKSISFKKDKTEAAAAEQKSAEVRQEKSRDRLLIEKKDDISKKILEDSRNFEHSTKIKFLLKNPNAVNSIKRQIPNFKTLFREYQRLAKNLCCVITAVEVLPQRTVEKTIEVELSEYEKQGAKDALVDAQKRTKEVLRYNVEKYEQLEAAKRQAKKDEEHRVAAAEIHKYWRQREADEREARGIRTMVLRVTPPDELDEAYEVASKKAFDSQMRYNNMLHNYHQTPLDEFFEAERQAEAVASITSTTTVKTYKWTPLLVTLEMSFDPNNLDDTNDTKLKEELKSFKELNSNLGDKITIKTLSGNLKLSNTQIKSIENSFTTQPANLTVPATGSVTLPQKSTEEIDPLLEFMDPKNNALVKSFEEAGGKGLAGVIESLDFSWLDQAMWDIDGGIDGGDQDPKSRKAPMMCKVSVSFAPIHDISPGLDFKGRNRAPVYPVGLAHIPDPTPPDTSTALRGDPINDSELA